MALKRQLALVLALFALVCGYMSRAPEVGHAAPTRSYRRSRWMSQPKRRRARRRRAAPKEDMFAVVSALPLAAEEAGPGAVTANEAAPAMGGERV